MINNIKNQYSINTLIQNMQELYRLFNYVNWSRLMNSIILHEMQRELQ